MANKKIEQLTDDSGVNMTVNDLLPFAKYVSPGVYTTVFKKGSNIINTITGLPTVNFTNINTSINAVSNNILPTVKGYCNILDVFETGVSLASGVSTLISIGPGITGNMFANRPYIINLKIYAYSNGPVSVKVQEYNMAFVNTSIFGGNLNADKLYEYNDAGGVDISINASSISYNAGSDSLRFSVSHSISGEFVSIFATATIYY